jgi:hypothetical protein
MSPSWRRPIFCPDDPALAAGAGPYVLSFSKIAA